MRPRAAIFLTSAVITSVFFINFCATVFRCGCASLWNGADAHCNVHLAGLHRCPWCVHGLIASAIPYLLIIAAQAAVSFWPKAMPPTVRLASAAAAFPIVGVLVALLYGLATGYWN